MFPYVLRIGTLVTQIILWCWKAELLIPGRLQRSWECRFRPLKRAGRARVGLLLLPLRNTWRFLPRLCFFALLVVDLKLEAKSPPFPL